MESFRVLMLCLSALTLMMLLKFPQVRGDCNLCTGGRACVSENEWQYCTGQEPNGIIYPCNGDDVCAFGSECAPLDSDPIIDCNGCHQCNEARTHACTGTRTFRLCLNQANYTEVGGTCGDNYVCVVDSPNICEDSGATCSFRDDPTTTSTTTTTTTTSTTPSPLTDPRGYCAAMGEEGRYPLGTDPKTTCRQFLRCILHNGAWVSAVYYCPNATYFDSTRGTCTQTLPTLCAGRVRSLSLFDIEI